MINHRTFVLSSHSSENNSDGLSIKCSANEQTTISARGSSGVDAVSSSASLCTMGYCVPVETFVDVLGQAPSPISLNESVAQG